VAKIEEKGSEIEVFTSAKGEYKITGLDSITKPSGGGGGTRKNSFTGKTRKVDAGKKEGKPHEKDANLQGDLMGEKGRN